MKYSKFRDVVTPYLDVNTTLISASDYPDQNLYYRLNNNKLFKHTIYFLPCKERRTTAFSTAFSRFRLFLCLVFAFI